MESIITLEQIKQTGFQFVGQGTKPDFIVSSRTDTVSFENMRFAKQIEKILNEKLVLKNFSTEKVKHITFIFNVLKPNGKGVNWIERQEYIPKNKQFRLEIKFTNYSEFIIANEQEALKIMASETLRGVKKFLSGVKDFNFERFYADLEDLFKQQGWV